MAVKSKLSFTDQAAVFSAAAAYRITPQVIGTWNPYLIRTPRLLVPIAGNPSTITSILNGITDGVHGPVSSIVQPLNYYWPGSFKVTEKDWAGVTVKWDNRSQQTVLHNDMACVGLVSKK